VSTAEPSRSPVEQAVELCVYLPLGFVLDFPASVPRFVDRGRRQVELTRVLGRQQARKVQRQATGTLRALGLLESPPAATTGTAPTVTRRPSTATPAPGHAAPASGGPDGATRAPATDIDPDSLAVPGYDSLSASQVVPRLEALTEDELEQVRRYEAGTRARKTILNKIAQLQAP
jgi:hypothetical protein